MTALSPSPAFLASGVLFRPKTHLVDFFWCSQRKSGVTMVPISLGRNATGTRLLTFVTKTIRNGHCDPKTLYKFNLTGSSGYRGNRSVQTDENLLASHINTRVFTDLLSYVTQLLSH